MESPPLLDRQPQTTYDCWEIEREWPPGLVLLLVVEYRMVSLEPIYTPPAGIDSGCSIYVYECTYIHVYTQRGNVCNNNNQRKKKSINLRMGVPRLRALGNCYLCWGELHGCSCLWVISFPGGELSPIFLYITLIKLIGFNRINKWIKLNKWINA